MTCRSIDSSSRDHDATPAQSPAQRDDLISILIANWNSKDYVKACLLALERSHGLDGVQVIVVDSASFDGCQQMLATEFPTVEFLQLSQNVGFGQANNAGLSLVRGRNLLLLNPDTEIHPMSIRHMVTALERDPSVGLVGPRLLNTDGTLQTSCVQRLPTPWTEFFDADLLRRTFSFLQYWGTRDAYSSTQPTEVEAVSGACMLLRTETFRTLGGFSPQYFMYAEDMDLCFKVHRAGLKVLHVPAAIVTHHGGGSSRSQHSSFSTIMMRESLLAYMLSNRGTASALLYRFLMGVSAVLRTLLLLPLTACGLPKKNPERTRAALHKWISVLRWSLHLEPWAKRYYPAQRSTGLPKTSHA